MKDKCDFYFVYIKEAHSVERDANGKFVDGWPRGYPFEYAKHKSMADRRKMAKLFETEFDIVECPILLDIMPNDKFDVTFGMWPDNMVAFKNGEFIFRGCIFLDGSRPVPHTIQLRNYIEKESKEMI